MCTDRVNSLGVRFCFAGTAALARERPADNKSVNHGCIRPPSALHSVSVSVRKLPRMFTRVCVAILLPVRERTVQCSCRVLATVHIPTDFRIYTPFNR